MIDMTKACGRTAELLGQVRDDQLRAATPCREMNLGALIAHLGGLAPAFDAAARKDFGPLTDTPPQLGDGPEADWRQAYPPRLTALAEAWRDPAAYEGSTQAGPIEMPADDAALVALDEVTVHAWDLAVATGQPYDADPAAVEACARFVAAFDAPTDEGLFGPPVDVPDSAPRLHRLLGATGRDPHWTPS
jgi:uncharacterized protein (TIGR03086 family)